LNDKGVANFAVKTSAITQANAVNKVFKLVKFDPVALFASAIDRAQVLYDGNPAASTAARYDMFYKMEKARETRLFGTDAEMLAFQPMLDNAYNNFSSFVDLKTAVESAKTFI